MRPNPFLALLAACSIVGTYASRCQLSPSTTTTAAAQPASNPLCDPQFLFQASICCVTGVAGDGLTLYHQDQTNTPQACADVCKTYSDCVVFRYTPGDHTCALYQGSVDIDNMVDVKGVDISDLQTSPVFFNRWCYGAQQK
ncbi:hypothetical protein AUP68_10072 [Ilyonectria robusta]|nr:hypothetical protein BKA56DRAFT_620848 [Ilyonectria sp. MPI-CAGE-AT-0026]